MPLFSQRPGLTIHRVSSVTVTREEVSTVCLERCKSLPDPRPVSQPPVWVGWLAKGLRELLLVVLEAAFRAYLS